jgi:hypothetical protein
MVAGRTSAVVIQIIAIQITDDRVITLRRNRPGHWRVYVDTRSYEVDDAMLMDPFRMDWVCHLKLSRYDKHTYLRSLLAGFKRAGVSIVEEAAPPKAQLFWEDIIAK